MSVRCGVRMNPIQFTIRETENLRYRKVLCIVLFLQEIFATYSDSNEDVRTVVLYLNGDVETCTVCRDDFEEWTDNRIAVPVVLPREKYSLLKTAYIDCIGYLREDNAFVVEIMKSIFTSRETWIPVSLYVWKSKILLRRDVFYTIFLPSPRHGYPILADIPQTVSIGDIVSDAYLEDDDISMFEDFLENVSFSDMEMYE